MAELQNLVVTGEAVIVGKLRVSGDAEIVAPEAEKAKVAETAQVAQRLASPIIIDGLTVDGSNEVVVAYAVCETAGDEATKTAVLDGFTLVYGAETTVKFINANTAENPTLNINNTQPVPIYYRGSAIPIDYIVSNSTLLFRYNGSEFDVVGEVVTSRVDTLENELQHHGHQISSIEGLQDALDDLADMAPTDHKHEIADVNGLQTALDGKSNDGHKHEISDVNGLQTALNNKAAEDHTHDYAGSSTPGGPATSAEKLNTNAGDETTPVYFKDGVPVPVTSISVSTSGNAATANKANEATTLTGLNATITELNYVDGVTSPIQTQLNNKAESDHEHSYSELNGLPTIPTKVSELANDAGYVTTDTTYTEATGSKAGLMSASDKAKLDTVAENANNYSHPTYTAKGNGFYKVTVDGTGHVSGTTEVTKADITGLGIPAQDTTYSEATDAKAGLMSAADKAKLDDIAENANNYVHPTHTAKSNGFYKVTVDSSGHVSGTAAVTKDDITGLGIPAQDTTYSEATTSKSGLMSSGDKTKLNNIEAGANKTVVDTELSETSTNPVENRVVYGMLENIVTEFGDAIDGINSTLESHDHDGRYYTESETDALLAKKETAGAAATALTNAKGYTDEKIGALTTIVNGKETAGAAAQALKDANKYTDDKIDELIGTASETRDTLGELSDAIKDNADTIEALETIAAGKAPLVHGHDDATTSTAGFMTAADKSKLDGIASGANKYTHPTHTAAASGMYKVTVDGSGHVTATSAITKNDIIGLGIDAENTTYDEATTSTAGLMSASDKSKLDGIASGANKYTHPTHTAKSNGFYKVTVDSSGHISGTAAVTKDDITGLGIPAQDTTYSNATTSKAGLMSTTDKSKLDGIAENANNYSHPTYTSKSSGFYKVTVDGTGHVSGATAVTKADITGLGIPAQDTTYSEATTSAAGLMSASDKTKLNGIASGAEVNQNAFSNVTVGSTTIAADSKTDTLTFVAGSNVTITPDATNDKITIAATDTTYGAATTSAAGLMSTDDKSKLDGITAGANKYTHPSYTAKSAGFYKVTVDASGHVSAATAVAKSDITALGIPAQDTTYSAATTSAAGLMSADDKSKLDGIASGANKYTHPSYTAKSAGFYKVTVDASGHVSAATAVTKSDITGLGIPAQDTTYSAATTSAAGLMSADDKSKLDGIAAGANKYTHPTHTAAASGLYKVTVDGSGHVTATTAVTKSDITALGIPAQDTTYSLSSFGITSTAAELNYVDGVTSNIQTQLNGKVDLMPYEYTKNVNFGSTGLLYIGKFKIYDSQITVDITATTSTTYSGKLVIATQNYNLLKATVYGDASNTIAPNIYIKPCTPNDQFLEIYFQPASWSKNIIHIYTAAAYGAENICQSVTEIPSTATTKPVNALTNAFASASHTHSIATDDQIRALFA